MHDLTAYHAHIYFSAQDRSVALNLREEFEAKATVSAAEIVIGRVHDKPVGPHPQPMFQVKFQQSDFAHLVPWLMQQRGPLNILVHGDTGDDLLDHTQPGMWLGQSLPLDLSAFS